MNQPGHRAASPVLTSGGIACACALIGAAAERVRGSRRCPPDRVAAAIGRAAARWRDREFVMRRETVDGLQSALGFSRALLDESIDALIEPVTEPALRSLAARLPAIDRTIGFLMPGNVPGAGIHEFCAAMLSGAGVIIKSASAEPRFFAAFISTVGEIDAAVGARAVEVNFGRGDDEALREVWARCDGGVVAYGDDASIAAVSAAAPERSAAPFAGFGSRLSGALVVTAGASPSAADSAAEGLACDIALFEQRGCLSPHHVFVVGGAGERLPPPKRLPLETATAIRALRERARWRALARRGSSAAAALDSDVALWEGESAGTRPTNDGSGMPWTVVFDAGASFCVSPGYRTVFVSALGRADELEPGLGAASDYLEAFALSAPADVRDEIEGDLRRLGVSYVSQPGRMQSPPLDWAHGGGAMFGLLHRAAR